MDYAHTDSKISIGWGLVFFYAVFVTAGVLNVYSASYDESFPSLFDFSRYGGKQLMFAAMSVVLIVVVMLLDMRVYERTAWIFYIFSILLLLGLPLLGTEIKGSKAWYNLGFVSLQPSEIAKFSTALALSAYLSGYNVSLRKIRCQAIAVAVILLPMVLVGWQDTGSALVFASFFIVLFMAGAPGIYFAVGILSAVIFVADIFMQYYDVSSAFILVPVGIAAAALCIRNLLRRRGIWKIVLSTVFIVGIYSALHFYVWDNVFKDYQRQRILTAFKLVEDNKGVGFNTFQSEIAIGSGGMWGKGFLSGTQTKGNFVPEQHTDFIFSTLGEEWGFVGTATVVVLYALFLIQIVRIAARQRTYFARYYGWCVFSVFFFHFLVNVAMAIGIMPVIGIPLPFFSYGGSSLWSFTILLFILIKIDAHRKDVLPEMSNFDDH